MMTADKLKDSILALAFSGKLVDQNPKETLRIDVLQKIENNSNNKKVVRIIKENDGLHYSLFGGKKVCVQDDLLFDIPTTWRWTSLKNIANVKYGYPFNSALFNDTKNGTPLIRIRDVLKGFTNTYTNEVCDDEYIVNDGEMLVGMDGNFNVNFWNGGKAYLNQRVCIITANDKLLDQKFLAYYLPIEFSRISNNVSFVTVKHLSDKHLNSLFIPLPPLAEQKRIVAKIEELMPFVEQYAAASTKLDTLNTSFPDMMKKSILQEAVQGKLVPQDPNDEPAGELLKKIAEEKKRLIKEGKIKKQKPLPEITEDEIPFDVPDSWKWVRLGNISSYAQPKDKISPKEITPYMWSLDLEDIEKGTGEILSRVFAKDRKIKGEKVKFKAGNILYSKLRPYLLKILIADSDGITSPELVPFEIYGIQDPSFFLWLLRSPYVDNTVNSVSYGVKMPRVGTDTMTNLVIPIPPLAEQKRIVAKIEELLTDIDKLAK